MVILLFTGKRILRAETAVLAGLAILGNMMEN